MDESKENVKTAFDEIVIVFPKDVSESATPQKEESNSQFGTCWIHNLEGEINKRIKKEEMEKYLQEGWESGMKMRFFQKIKKEDNPPT
jgi:hypothetical protein